MLTKGAIGNLINRYRAVLKKCNLINTFGSLAVASMLVMGGAGVASAKTIGGEDLSYSDKAPTITNFELTVSENTDEVISGSYFGVNTSTPGLQNKDNKYDLGTTTTVIKDGLTIEEGAYGGSKIAGGYPDGGNHPYVGLTLHTDRTNLTIEGSTFGTYSSSVGENAMRRIVTAGDFIKDRGTNYGAVIKLETEIDSANLYIKDGTFHSQIFGGSVLANYAYQLVNLKSTVKNSNIIIDGGTFNAPVFAGGAAINLHSSTTIDPEGKQNTSIVENANLTINGGKFETDIYAGGLKGYAPEGTTSVIPVAKVYNASITINNASVNGVIGSSVKGVINSDSTWTYTIDEATNTTLTFINSEANTIDIPVGSVELRVENKGKVKIADFKPGAGVPVTMSTDGVTNDFFGGDAQKLVDDSFVFNDNTQKDGKLRAEAGIVIGELTGDVVDGVVSNVTEKPSETNVAMADLPLINHMLTRVEMNDLRKRMGDIRLLEGETGTWARWEGGRLKGDNGLTNDFHKIQLGADTTTGIESLRLGASFSYTNGDMDFAKASAESDTLSFAGYGVWTADNGMFADVIARLAFIDTEIQTDKVKGELDNLAFSLSGEYGWRFNLCDQFFVEPQVELTYTYIDSDDFTSAGAKFDFDSSDSLIGRAGLAAGWKLPDDRGDLYARASVVQEFMGDGKLTASMGNTLRRYETDGDDTWFEYGIGANIKLNKNVYVFGDVERTEGADIEEEWRGTVGVRFSF